MAACGLGASAAPLAADKAAGKTSGEGLNLSGGLWWAVSPAGKAVKNTSSSSGGEGGGYGGGGEPDPWASDSSSSGGGYSDEPPF